MRKHLRHLFILPLLLTLAACSGDKYPLAPKFTNAYEVPPSTLPTPPAQNAASTQRELKGIIARQAAMTQAERDAVKAEDRITPAMMVAPVLGSQYTEETHPALFALLRQSASDAWRISDNTQDHYKRPRPWTIDKRVELLVSTITRPSYPSGHTTTNHVWAHVLSELFPAKRNALFNRAYAIGMHRVDAGVHYPSDVVAGKKLAAAIFAKMKVNADFKAALSAARAELKSAKPAKAANDNAPKAANCSKQAGGMAMCH